MVDTAIVAVSDDSWMEFRARSNYVWVGESGYYVRMQAGAGATHTRRVDYMKTVDGGVTLPWTKTEIFDSGASTSLVDGVDIWYDQWTPGDTGTLIHIFIWHEVTTRMKARYFTLDTVDDTLTEVNDDCVGDPVDAAAARTVAITKLEDGTIAISFVEASSNEEVWVSTDSGANFTQLSADPSPAAESRFALYPTDSSDPKDMLRPEWDQVNDDLIADIWKNSDETWTPTIVGNSGDFIWGTNGENMWSSTLRQSDKTTLIAIHTHRAGNSHDLEVWTIHWDGTTLTVAELTKVLTATSTVAGVSILIDNNNDDLIVHYLDGTLGSAVVQKVISTDGGSTWGSPVQISSADTDYLTIWDTPQITGVGRTHPIFNLDASSAQTSLPKTNGGTPLGQKGSTGGVIPALVAAGYI